MKTNKREDLIKNYQPLIIAGPCAIESKAQISIIAKSLTDMGIKILRCQLWKPRTDPDSFQGVGLSGLKWLKEIKDKYKILIATEITDKHQIEATKGVVDILWVGARNMQNYELLKALGKDNRPVILKRGLISTVDEWIKAGKYIGLDKIILCERGIRTGADAMRFTLDLNAALVAKHDHGMPVIIDPSHTTGRADMVPYLAYAGIAAGMDGIVVEVHHEPHRALSDASQQITPEKFQQTLNLVRAIYELRHQKDPINISLKPSRKTNLPLTKKPTKTLLLLAVYNRIGILKDILSVFADYNLNLNKIESQPSQGEDLDYYFHIEVESSDDEPRLMEAIKVLKEFCPIIKIIDDRL